jgi:hypothetical protein
MEFVVSKYNVAIQLFGLGIERVFIYLTCLINQAQFRSCIGDIPCVSFVHTLHHNASQSRNTELCDNFLKSNCLCFIIGDIQIHSGLNLIYWIKNSNAFKEFEQLLLIRLLPEQ